MNEEDDDDDDLDENNRKDVPRTFGKECIPRQNRKKYTDTNSKVIKSNWEFFS